MRLRITVRFTKESLFKDARRKVLEAVKPVTEKHANLIVESARASMAEGKSGIHHRGLPNRSSAPGEAPANQSGALSASLTAKAEDRANGARYRVGTGLWYGNYLMMSRNRPMLLPALQKQVDPFVEDLKEAIKGAF
jgi:hypothetical protein